MRSACRSSSSSSNASAGVGCSAGATLEQALAEAGASAQLVLAAPELRSSGATREQMLEALASLSQAVPRRSLGSLLERCPALLAAPVGGWLDFLGTFGFPRLATQELLVNSPDIVCGSSVFRAGQVFLFLRQLGVPNEQIVGPIFKWRALLAEGVDFEAAAAFLRDEAALAPPILARVAVEYPSLLAASAEAELRPRLAFLLSLGPRAPEALRGVLYEDWCGWVHGLAQWHTAVAPKLRALQEVLGGDAAAAEAVLRAAPGALRHAAESRLRPNVRLLTGRMGLEPKALAALLSAVPSIMALSPDQLESRFTFLTEALDGTVADLLAYPPYLMASLSRVTAPRFFYVAQRGLSDCLRLRMGDEAAQSARAARGQEEAGDAAAGLQGCGCELDLQWLVEGADEDFLRRVAEAQHRLARTAAGGAAARGGRTRAASVPPLVAALSTAAAAGSGSAGSGQTRVAEDEALLLLRGDYEEVAAEFEALLGWCADRAFTEAGQRKHEEQLSLFYLLVQA